MPAQRKTVVKKIATAKGGRKGLDFSTLVSAIREVHERCVAEAGRAVNASLTLRNWLIGWHVREYEQHGADRAKYGEAVLDKVADRLVAEGVAELTARYLRLCRHFATEYPGIWRSVTAESARAFLPDPIWRSLTAKSAAVPDLPARAGSPLALPAEKLVGALSFTHFEQLIAIDEPLKRAFYEIECVRGNWSVRALKRQIATLYFERSGLSKNKKKLAAMVSKGTDAADPNLAISDPYIFGFLGLRANEAMAEADLEVALLHHLREFLLELGHGFCLEAQQ